MRQDALVSLAEQDPRSGNAQEMGLERGQSCYFRAERLQPPLELEIMDELLSGRNFSRCGKKERGG